MNIWNNFFSAYQTDFGVDKINNISSYMCESYVFPLYLWNNIHIFILPDVILITYAWKNKVILFSFAICINILYVPHWLYVKRNNLCKNGQLRIICIFFFNFVSRSQVVVFYTYFASHNLGHELHLKSSLYFSNDE